MQQKRMPRTAKRRLALTNAVMGILSHSRALRQSERALTFVRQRMSQMAYALNCENWNLNSFHGRKTGAVKHSSHL